MVDKFEVGKKYRSSFGGNYSLCIGFSASGKPVLEKGENNFFSPNLNLNWIEYKEPKRGTVWVNVYPDSIRGMAPGSCLGHPTREKADSYADEGRIACVEVPWVEGQGLE